MISDHFNFASYLVYAQLDPFQMVLHFSFTLMTS